MRKLRPLLTILLFPLLMHAQETSQLKGIGLYPGPLPSVINYNTTFGNYLYLVGDDNIFIYNLVDPENPAYIKTIPDSNAKKIWAGGNSMLAVYDGSNISLYDISDPENPNKKSDYTAGDDIVLCRLNGNYMFVMYRFELSYNKYGAFEIIDITDPSKPTLTDSFKQGYENGSSFCLSPDFSKVYTANYIYADEKTVIHELDISNPYDIKDLKTITLDNLTQNIDIYDSYIFLLQFKPWSGPSYLKAINVADDNNWIEFTPMLVSNSQAQDMHVQDSSLTISLMEGGIKDYTFSPSTNIFTEGQSVEYDRSSHMAMSQPIQSTGPTATNMLFKNANSEDWSLIFYYVMDNNAPANGYRHSYEGKRIYIVKKWIKKIIDDKVFLTMDIEPTDAERNGCGVSPAIGTHEYKKGESVIITSKDNPNDGWFFNEWTGAVSGTNKQAILLMDVNKTVVAHFKEVKLNVAGSETEMKCICDVNGEEVKMVTLSATAYGDNWIMTGITLNAHGDERDTTWISEVNVKQGNNKLWSTTFFDSYNVSHR